MPPMVFGYPRHLDDDVWNNQLCVPNDNLDDLDFFPNFYDDLIRLAGFPLDGDDSWKDFDPERSRSPMTCPNKQENNNLSDEESRDAIPHKQETNSWDENSRDALFPYEREIESKKKPIIISVRKSCLSVKRRVCSHCQAEKTPQWREGPNGPKTLCNACGVRYKSGRLVPEYRPAASPSFDSRKHSNFHKRIVRKKL